MTPPAFADPDRARGAGRGLRILLLTAFLLHLGIAGAGWSQASGLTIVGGRSDPRELALVIGDQVENAAGVLAVLTLAVLALSGWRRPRRPGLRFVPWEWPLAGALVVVAALLPLHGRFDLQHGARLPASWIQRLCYTGGILALLAGLVVLQITVATLLSRGPARAERREALRDGLALWGFLLLAGATLGLEWRTVDLMSEMRILGPRAPAWGSLPGVWLASNRLLLAFAFVGLVATLFGAWHLRRREAPSSPDPAASLPPS